MRLQSLERAVGARAVPLEASAGAHTAAAAKGYTGEAAGVIVAQAAAIAAAMRTAALEPADRAMLGYAEKLTLTPWEMVEEDVTALRSAGFDDAEAADDAGSHLDLERGGGLSQRLRGGEAQERGVDLMAPRAQGGRGEGDVPVDPQLDGVALERGTSNRGQTKPIQHDARCPPRLAVAPPVPDVGFKSEMWGLDFLSV